MSSDFNEDYNVFANNELKGGIAFLTNALGGSKELSFNNEQFWVWKGASNDRTYAKIDYYYPPELGNKVWYFYYHYKHNNNKWYDMYLGTAWLSNTTGLNSFDATEFSCERKEACKIGVTLPSIPDDVPNNLQTNRERQCKYTFTLTYKLYNGSSKMQKESFDCEKNTNKECVISIPTECANFKYVDMSVDIQEGLYCKANGKYFWKNNFNILKNNAFPSAPQPQDARAEFLQYDGKIEINWQSFIDYGNGYQYIGMSKPYIYRMETDKQGEKLSGEKWKRLDILNDVGTQQSRYYIDNNVDPNKYYKYLILNVPNDWAGVGDTNDSELSNPSETLISMLGHVETNVVETSPSMDIFGLRQLTDIEDKVVLNWYYSRVPVSSQTVRFVVKRRPSNTDTWTEIGEVQADANPKVDAFLTFTDNTIASNRVRYDYKVCLSINDGKNTFESDIITGGLIAGSTITAFDATKGQHSDLVRVTWNVRQLGLDNTNFEVYRRYLNSNNEFMKVYATSGTSSSYSYEDKTVQPGYYYEYKVECYSGDKDSYDESTYQNAATAIGFCQSTGVISGRVTYSSAGSSVEDVRLTLRGDNDGEGNIQQYSQRVNGATAGIVWNADSTETASLFGSDKNYTVQFFVRPDERLQEGSVLAEIPNLGRLLLGNKEDSGYKLLLERYSETKERIRNTFKQYWEVHAVLFDTDSLDANGHSYYSEELGGFVYGNNAELDSCTYAEPILSSYVLEIFWLDLIGFTQKPIGCSLYFKHSPIPEIYGDVMMDMTSFDGKVYDTGLVLPSNEYSLINMQSLNQENTLWVNGTRMSTLKEIATRRHEESLIEKNPHFLLHDNESLYTMEGIDADIFQALYKKASNLGAWFPVNGNLQKETFHFQNQFSLGGTSPMEESEAFSGYLCEARVWDHALSEKERAQTDDRIMCGNENGLKVYWPMSEGIDRLVVDGSYTNDVPNGHHATVGNNIKASNIVPSDNQLSRYAITNSNGEYTLRGVPFVGSGSGYTLYPSKSIHTFNPTSRNGFVSASSMVLNNYDFTDQSSFTIRGKVTYKDTNIPADSIMFMIDGALAQHDNKHVMTDANGNYELSMPIGTHTFEAFKNGHVFSRFPEDGTVYNFKQDEIVNFFDSTLVNVTGRINGGFTDKDEPLGFKRSVNRLGKATLQLSLGKESQCSFNYIVDNHGNGEIGTTPIAVESATDAIQSTAYRDCGSLESSYYIYITTDSLTGEFSAMLPPLRYMVNSITFAGGDTYDNEPVFKENLPIIDATNTIPEKMLCDSLISENENAEYYYYSAKLIRQLRTTPTITVEQKGKENGAFGERSLTVNTDLTRSPVDVPVVNFTQDGYEYLYGHPIFKQGNAYEFIIHLSEQYINQDTKEVYKEVPEDAVVNISNEASTTGASIVAVDIQEAGQDMHLGDVYEVENLEVTPSDEGVVGYGWIAGLPNLSEGFLRNMSIGVSVDGRTTVWQAPDSRTDALDFVVSGGIPSGTNFVTGAPDQIDMILRRPPGSTAYAQWSNDSVRVWTKTVTTTTSCSRGGGLNVTILPSYSTQVGQGVFEETKYRYIFYDTSIRRNNVYDDIEVEKAKNTYSVSTTMKTPSGNKYVQNNGDTYIGRSRNLQFGNGRFVGLLLQEDGTYKLGMKESLCTGFEFGTTFVLPQRYVEETLIPNWQAIIESKLTYVPQYSESDCKKVEGKVMYYTTLKKGDYGYGSANSDEDVWSKEQYLAADGHPSYIVVDGITRADDEIWTDSVEYCNQQIKVWKSEIRRNEQDKLKAFNDESTYFISNYSIGGGTSVNQTTNESYVNTVNLEHTKTAYNLTHDVKIGSTFNDSGAIGVMNFSNGGNTETVVNESITLTENTVWQISDASPATALSVDVYKSPSG